MKIREGKYYLTRNGRVIGPMREIVSRFAEKWKFWAIGFNDGAPCWTDEGRWSDVDNMHEMDLISEVYVSDTPPAVQKTEDKWRARLLAAGPGPFIEMQETKTLRDEFVMRLMDRDMFAVGFKDEAEQLYRVADALMEARKK